MSNLNKTSVVDWIRIVFKIEKHNKLQSTSVPAKIVQICGRVMGHNYSRIKRDNTN
jgi:hypothetical protein